MNENVVFADFGKDLDLRPEIHCAIHRSGHPAAIRYQVWVCQFLAAIDPFGLRGPPGAGQYVAPCPRSEINAMIRAALMLCFLFSWI